MGVHSLAVLRFIDALHQDLRYAVRALRHSRSFSVWVIGSLAIGMAVIIAALALLNASVFVPFAGVTAQDRLARVSVSRNCGRPDCWARMASASDYVALSEGLHGAQGLAAYTFGDVSAALPEARSLRSLSVSANYFDVLGVRPALGRTFGGRDADANAQVAVLGHAAWAREFGSDPSIVSRTIRVADRFVEIVGVAPPFFAGVDRARPGAPRAITVERGPDIWLPMWMGAGAVAPHEDGLSFVARLADGVTVEQLQAEATVLAARLAASNQHPAPAARADVRELRRVNPRTWRFAVLILMPIPVLVLLIACVNAANLMLARGSQRQREIAIRLAVGGARRRIIRQLLAESALLSIVATASALALAWWALRLASHPLGMPLPFDPTVLALTLLTAAVTTVAFGLAPALRVSRQQPSSMLGSGSRTDAVPPQSRSRRALLVAQVTLSLALLATGSQLVSTVRTQAVSAGTPADRVLIARFDLQPLAFTAAAAEAFYRDATAAVSRLPGVEAVGLARHSAVWSFGQGTDPSSFQVWQGHDAPAAGQTTSGGYAGGELFDVVGLRVVAGRGFTEADRQGRPRVALINESAARTLIGPPVGALLHVAPRGKPFESAIEVRVVGVVEAAREPRLDQESAPAAKVYLPAPLEAEPALSLYLRSTGTASSLAQSVREAVRGIAAAVPIVEIGSLEELNERAYTVQLWLARAAAFIGVVGLLLATAGLYGVSSYVVTMRSREMAIRMAIGARPRAIVLMVLAQSMRVALVGLVAGGGAALVVSRLIQAEYHGIRDIDVTAFATAVSLFLVAMLAASMAPAIRASRVDTIHALKES